MVGPGRLAKVPGLVANLAWVQVVQGQMLGAWMSEEEVA